MTRAERFTERLDQTVLGFIPAEAPGIGVVDLRNWGFRLTSLRASLDRLLADDVIQRRWDGNERFGRFLYTRVVS